MFLFCANIRALVANQPDCVRGRRQWHKVCNRQTQGSPKPAISESEDMVSRTKSNNSRPRQESACRGCVRQDENETSLVDATAHETGSPRDE